MKWALFAKTGWMLSALPASKKWVTHPNCGMGEIANVTLDCQSLDPYEGDFEYDNDIITRAKVYDMVRLAAIRQNSTESGIQGHESSKLMQTKIASLLSLHSRHVAQLLANQRRGYHEVFSQFDLQHMKQVINTEMIALCLLMSDLSMIEKTSHGFRIEFTTIGRNNHLVFDALQRCSHFVPSQINGHFLNQFRLRLHDDNIHSRNANTQSVSKGTFYSDDIQELSFVLIPSTSYAKLVKNVMSLAAYPLIYQAMDDFVQMRNSVNISMPDLPSDNISRNAVIEHKVHPSENEDMKMRSNHNESKRNNNQQDSHIYDTETETEEEEKDNDIQRDMNPRGHYKYLLKNKIIFKV
jgi:hypothetical protein